MLRLLVVLIFLCIYTPAYAQSISAIGGASVNKGALSVELRTGFATDNDPVSASQDERLRTRFHVDYGVTDHYAARIILKGDKRKGNTYEHEALEFENRFEVFSREDHGFDGGFRVNYALKDGDKKPDSLTVRLVEVVPLEKWELRFNQFFSHDIGQDSEGGFSFESRMQATYGFTKKLRGGMDSFNDFGRLKELSGYTEQAHSLGPVVKYKLGNGYGVETSYLAGISEAAADHSFKFFVSKAF